VLTKKQRRSSRLRMQNRIRKAPAAVRTGEYVSFNFMKNPLQWLQGVLAAVSYRKAGAR
jgi:hypothetical protein